MLEHVEALAREAFIPVAHKGEAGHVNRDLVSALGDSGLIAKVLAEGDVPAIELCLIREGLARLSTHSETAFALQGLGAHPILTAGHADIAAQWIPRVAAGDAVAGFALTEPGAGSDAGAISLAAERDGNDFVLTGEKTYISNAPEADVYSVFARTTPGAGVRGITAFAVAGDSSGLGGESISLLSDHAVGTLHFQKVRVPSSQVLGEVDAGFKVAMNTLDLFRPSVGAAAVGMAQAALEAAVAHVTTREAFGKRLSEFQGVSHQLADAATKVQAARLLVHAAATAYDKGIRPSSESAAMAKLFATETAQEVIDVAIQVHGARALEQGHLLEHLYRDVRALRIYEGTSEIQREIIARRLLRTAD